MIYDSCFPYALDALSTYTFLMTLANGNKIVSVYHASSHPDLYLQGHANYPFLLCFIQDWSLDLPSFSSHFH